MGIEVTKDEADKRRRDPLAMPEAAPGMHQRWVRTKGYDAEGHQSRMREMGYEPVERNGGSLEKDPRHKTGQHSQTDNKYTRGDLMLMQIPTERHEQFRREQQELTRSRTGAVDDQLRRNR